MDADSLKIVFAIFYLTLLVVIGCIWLRATHAPNGEMYRRVRRDGGYKTLDPFEDNEQATGAAGQEACTPNSST
ncbi:MAG: hypothetical protein M3R60_10985 [Pseudomonadota bacterium]|nr:hypothetical protein [Pseudomonadota bacterium]